MELSKEELNVIWDALIFKSCDLDNDLSIAVRNSKYSKDDSMKELYSDMAVRIRSYFKRVNALADRVLSEKEK